VFVDSSQAPAQLLHPNPRTLQLCWLLLPFLEHLGSLASKPSVPLASLPGTLLPKTSTCLELSHLAFCHVALTSRSDVKPKPWVLLRGHAMTSKSVMTPKTKMDPFLTLHFFRKELCICSCVCVCVSVCESVCLCVRHMFVPSDLVSMFASK
jgi:hypothetical protein